MRIVLFLASLAFFMLGILFFQDEAPHSEKPSVLVSVQPYSYIVERLGGDAVDTVLLVPAGADAHTFEPTLKQVQGTTQARIWFRIGDVFESKFVKTLSYHSPETKLVALQDGLPLIMGAHGDFCCSHSHSHEHHSHSVHDPHIWLSARMMQGQVERIAEELASILPRDKDKIFARKAELLDELRLLDRDLTELFSNRQGKHVLVSHPAYSYFCRDYGIQQMTLEIDGREPSPQQVTALVQKVREEGIRTVFVQKQYFGKAVRAISEQLDLECVLLDPYSEDYLANLRKIGLLFAGEDL